MDHDFIFQNLVMEPFEIKVFEDVKISQHINEHSTLYVKALISDEDSTKYVNECREGKEVTLSYMDSQGKKCKLFQGIIQSVDEYFLRGSSSLEIRAISYTYLLDIDKKSRTFQNKSMKYRDMFDQVLGKHDSFDHMDHASDGKSLDELIVQYEETDWVFLQRMASHFETGLVSPLLCNHGVVEIGIPTGSRHSLDIYHYSLKKDMKKYMYFSQNGKSDVMEEDFVYYSIDSEIPMCIGDTVEFQGKSLIVNSVEAAVENGTLIYHAVLSRKNGMIMLRRENQNIIGCSLNASITEIQNDRVKVSIEIDQIAGHDPGSPQFFPYSTIYSSQDGSGWYCMPEKGDSVRIYFPDAIEDHSYAISSVHDAVSGGGSDEAGEGGGSGSGSGSGNAAGAGSYSGMRDDPSVKSLKNSDGKEIRLTPEGIYILSDGTNIILTDEGGVSIVSDKDIEFKSDQNIVISAEQDISIIGSTGVDLNCNDTSFIKMAENIEVIGQEVKAN